MREKFGRRGRQEEDRNVRHRERVVENQKSELYAIGSPVRVIRFVQGQAKLPAFTRDSKENAPTGGAFVEEQGKATRLDIVKKRELLKALQTEIERHSLSTFMKDGVVQTGCPACMKHFGTVQQFTRHLTDDVLPSLIDKLSTEKPESADNRY